MNPDILLSWLNSDSSTKRVRAARAFKRQPDSKYVDQLRLAHQKEDVPWIRDALTEAIDAMSSKKGVRAPNNDRGRRPRSADPDNSLDIEAIQSEAIDDSIGKILHELEPTVGAIKVIASEEIDDYAKSKTKEEFKTLDDLLGTFEDWRRVEQSPRFEEENLYQIVANLVDQSRYANVTLRIDHDLVFRTDRSLLRIIFSNAIRNAVEACNQLDETNPPRIVVSAALSDKGLWASVVDQGIGIPQGRGTALHNRQSTKPGHRGMGLPLIHKAVNTLGGSWELKNSAGGGASFSFEIPRVDS